MKARPPQGAILDYGLHALRFAGLEATESIYGSVAHTEVGSNGDTQWFLLTPAQVTESMNNLNAAVIALDGDVAANVSRQAFKDAWGAFRDAWNAFQKDNDSAIKLLLHGTGAMWRQTEQYRSQLDGWRNAYQRETGNLAPSGPIPSAPGPGMPPAKPAMSTSTKILLGVLGVLAVGGVGYATYRYVQDAKKTKKRLQGMAEEYAGRRLTGSGGASRMLAEGE